MRNKLFLSDTYSDTYIICDTLLFLGSINFYQSHRVSSAPCAKSPKPHTPTPVRPATAIKMQNERRASVEREANQTHWMTWNSGTPEPPGLQKRLHAPWPTPEPPQIREICVPSPRSMRNGGGAAATRPVPDRISSGVNPNMISRREEVFSPATRNFPVSRHGSPMLAFCV